MNPLEEKIDPAEANVVRQFTSTYPVKVGELAAELGLKVTRSALPPKISGLIRPSHETRSGFEIRVNKYDTVERQRFTVAHEIAHYLLHRREIGAGVVDNVMYRSGLTSKKETEANRLAADILMPAEAVGDEARKRAGMPVDDFVAAVASAFKVSVPAMKVRLGVS